MKEFPLESKEVAIEGLHITRGICLTKAIGFSDPEYDHYLEVEGNTSKLHLFTDDYTYYRLDGIKAYEAFINGNLKKYLKKENMIDDTILKEYFGYNNPDDYDDDEYFYESYD